MNTALDDVSAPAPGTARLLSEWKIISAECRWDANPHNPARALQIAQNLRGFRAHLTEYRRP